MNDVTNMANLINTLGYATVALSIIFVVFLALISFVIWQNKKLTENLISSNKQSIEELRKAINDLTSNISKMNSSYQMILEDITDEIVKLREKYIELTAQISNIVYEERRLSPYAFYEVVKRISTNCIYKSLIDVYTVLDINGFSDDKMIELLKDNIRTALERRRSEGIEAVKNLNFEQNNLYRFLAEGEEVYNKHISKLYDEIIGTINIEDLKDDKNYKRLKSLIKNNLFSYLDEICSLAKEISIK